MKNSLKKFQNLRKIRVPCSKNFEDLSENLKICQKNLEDLRKFCQNLKNG